MVRTLAMRLMILALTLASGPAPNAGSYDAGERLTAQNMSDKTCADTERLGVGVVRTAREESIFGKDSDGIDEENADCEVN
ncbi:unnamed protein product [Fusarium graminearum]|nr:unnamed protein product [Fusarium graminearum]CAG1963547.1 unnamed protein product [Fusarium graminearum]VTO84943.1 unnamed protein product [Fusarium graminearum]